MGKEDVDKMIACHTDFVGRYHGALCKFEEEIRDMRSDDDVRRLGYFEGERLVEIKQGFKLNDTTQKLVDDKQLFIMPVGSNRFVKVVNEGQPEMRQVQDNIANQDMTYDFRYMFKMGVGVQIGLRFGVWNIT